MLSKDNSLKLKFLRDILKLEQSTLALGLFYIGFIFYRRKQFVKTRTLKLSHFYYFFFSKGQVVCVSKYQRCHISSDRRPSWPNVSSTAVAGP